MSIENPNFLKKKYDLHKGDEVESAAKRTEGRRKFQNKKFIESGQEGPLLAEKITQDPAARIQNYLNRFKEITERTDPVKQERGKEALQHVLHSKFVIKPEDIPQSYYNLQAEIAIREGRQADLEQGGVEIQTVTKQNPDGQEVEVRNFIYPDELKEQAGAIVTNNQRHSLDKWVDYLASDDAQYPDWAKYWAFRSVLYMGKLQKKEDEHGRVIARFAKREMAKRNPTTGELKNDPTVAAFPPLNPRALALTIGVIRERLDEQAKPKKERQPIANQSIKLSDKEFQGLVSTEEFSKIYAQFLVEMPEYSPERLQETRGGWAIFPQGSDPMTYQPIITIEGQEYSGKPLVPSLEGYPLEWCTADPDTARTQLQGGDFHVYYSVNDLDEPVIPRLAIRMENDRIGEPPRGIAPDQNLDPYIAPVLEEKLKNFGPVGEAFKQRASNMKYLTIVESKAKVGQPLTRDDLNFLYEINSPIEGFGYQRDPRIEEVREQRNPREDAPIVLDCTPEQIAWSDAEVNKNTKAYIGPLFPGIFTKLQHLEHLYTTFPEGRIRRGSVEIGNIPTKEAVEGALTQRQIQISSYARDLLHSPDFTVAQQSEQINLVHLTVGDLGFTNGATTEEIYAKANEFGLDLCPAEVGPQLRLQEETEGRFGEYFFVAMKQIPDSSGDPGVFYLVRSAVGQWLGADYARPGSRWNSGNLFVFRLRK